MPLVEITNKKKYPQYVVDVCKNILAQYDKGLADYSVTTLIDSPRVHFLKERYEYTEDVDNLFKANWGTILHSHYEDTSQPRLFCSVGTVVISGLPDRVDLVEGKRILRDIKFTSSANQYAKAIKDKWEAQLNIYRWMLWKGKRPVSQMFIDAFFWDHKLGRRTGAGKSFKQKKWKYKDTEEYVTHRVDLFESLKDSEELPMCTDEERWFGRRCKKYCPVNEYCK